jgi:hypothetical protein
MGILLAVDAARAGSLDSPAAPTDAGSAMYTVTDIYNRLDTGAAGAKRAGSFVEPIGAPGSTGKTLDEIMAKAPATNANATVASEVLSGRVFWGLDAGAWGEQTGTLPNVEQQNVTPGTVAQTITQGVHDGTGEVAGDSDLVTGNIRAGVTIFGVSGAASVVDTSSGTAAAAHIFTGRKAWVNGVEVTGTMAASSAKHIKDDSPAAPSGVYWIDPDGYGGLAPFQVYCDMTTDGGGWMLVLNYVRAAGSTPSLTVLSSSLPLLGSDTLGSHEFGSSYWGHASASLMQKLSFTEVRMYGRSSAHGRTLHFKTTHAGLLQRFRTGSGSASGVQSSYTPLSGHNAYLPAAATVFDPGSSGDYGMTFAVMYAPSVLASWNINRPGFPPLWEMDFTLAVNGDATIHRVWVR